MGRHREAIAAEEQNRQLAEQLGDKVNAALSLINIALDYQQISEDQTSLDYYRRALEQGEAIHDRQAIQSASTGLARIYTDQRWQAYRFSQYAAIYNKMGGHYEDLLKAVEKGLDLANRVGDLRLEAWFLETRAETLKNHYRLRETLNDYQKAVEIFARLASVDQEVAGLTRVVDLHLSLHEPKLALAAAQRTCELAAKIDSVRIRSDAFDSRGRAYRAMHQRQEAEQDFRASIALLESARAQLVGGSDQGQNFFDRRIGAYRELMELRVEAGDLTGAVDAAEHARARHLLDMISQGKAVISHFLSAGEKQREQELTAEEARWNAEIAKPRPRPVPGASRSADPPR